MMIWRPNLQKILVFEKYSFKIVKKLLFLELYQTHLKYKFKNLPPYRPIDKLMKIP